MFSLYIKEGIMYCPKCGNELTETPAGLVCKIGGMELSKDLERRLREVYITKSREPRGKTFIFGVGGKWFFPQCGIQTIEENGSVHCPNCKPSLNEFIFTLIEHHPHFESNKGYV
jgi:uncharacterized Zn finger protein (UPF0148 family)